MISLSPPTICNSASMLNTRVHQSEVSMATDTVPIAEHGVATLPDQAWERARRRAEIIGPLAQSETVGHEAADAAAQALGLSQRQVYILIRRARQGLRRWSRYRSITQSST
ncbi:helix-turn-helix domain-containing protein [Citrobacter freundii]|uniref:helix-turn-helix domain-containing protein n=1 Tax=Citrobacter freundii TaxID=546 RepID=UPI001FFDFC81|nr:helix-turn-helix domain-containing protein [Citrobacter freundii]